MATRVIRWLEALKEEGKEPRIHWNQLRQVAHPKDENKVLDFSTDRHLHYAPRDKGKPVYKYSKEVREMLQKEALAVMALIEAVAFGRISRFIFRLTTGTVSYTQNFVVEGKSFSESKDTDDDTIVTACRALAENVAVACASKGKVIELAEADEPAPSSSAEGEEPEEPEV